MKPKICTLSFFAALGFAAGAMATVQASELSAEVYDVNFSLNNATPICSVYGLPQVDLTDGSVNVLDYSVDVDGSGKITGFAHLQLTSSDGTSMVMATVTGKMGMKGKDPVVNMSIKGPGFGNNGTAVGKANINMKFSGSPVLVGDGEGYYDYAMSGKVNGTFNPGIKGAKAVHAKNVDGTISSYDVAGTTQIDSCILTLIAVKNQLTLGGCLDAGNGNLDFHYEWNGKGNVNPNSGKFNFTLTGTSTMTDSTISVKGDSVVENPTLLSSDVSLTSMKATGKVMGQKVKAEGEGYLSVQTPE